MYHGTKQFYTESSFAFCCFPDLSLDQRAGVTDTPPDNQMNSRSSLQRLSSCILRTVLMQCILQVSPSTHMTMAVARRALYDLALTLRVHPLALGVIPESTAQVTMPESAIISTTMITDIIKYHGADSKAQKSFEKPMGFEAGLTRDIPPLIKELRVSAVRNKGPLRGVVVVEHRNLKKILTDNDFKVADVILVMASQRFSSLAD